MIIAKESLGGNLTNKQSIQGIINKATEYIAPKTQEKTITPTKQIQEVLPDENIDLLSKVTVNAIPDEYIIPNLQNKSITITENGTNTITKDVGYDGLNEIEITTNVTSEGATANVLMDDTLNYQGNFGGYEIITKVMSLNTSNYTTTRFLFSGFSELTEVPQQLNTSKVTNMEYMFNGCKKLIALPQMDTSRVTKMYNTFCNCSSLTSIPTFDTSNVTDMYNMFSGCSNLVNFPILNTSKVTRMNNIFASCGALSNESINNILQMCINAVAYTGFKRLTILGFSSAMHPASKIQALSNYQAFLDAGWIIGY